MKVWLAGMLLFVCVYGAFAQQEEEASFKYVELNLVDQGPYALSSNYYPIQDNISNSSSSVFVSTDPTPEQYFTFAQELPAHHFSVKQGTQVVAMIMVMQQPQQDGQSGFLYNIVNTKGGMGMKVPCSVSGEISEKRALELLALKVDAEAKLIEHQNGDRDLFFQGETYRIQSYELLQEEAAQLASELMVAGSK